MSEFVCIHAGVLASILHFAQRDPRRECCGILAGRDGVITRALLAKSAATNPTTGYEIAPKELFRLMREIRAAGLELLGIYHSHPKTENRPSSRDIELAYYPDAAYFILSPAADASRPIRAFRIKDGVVTELEIQSLA
jgi:proteasome lid subunit RPN8/RPN11